MLVAADTYRAAATEQLKIWAGRAGCELVCNEQTREPSAVLFDGLKSAKAQKTDVVIVDTAGRMHTYDNLMAELEKMFRVVEKRFPMFQQQNMITMDASLGQNSLIPVLEFPVNFTGIRGKGSRNPCERRDLPGELRRHNGAN